MDTVLDEINILVKSQQILLCPSLASLGVCPLYRHGRLVKMKSKHRIMKESPRFRSSKSVPGIVKTKLAVTPLTVSETRSPASRMCCQASFEWS